MKLACCLPSLSRSVYTKMHKDELPNHVAALVLDNGQGPVVRLDMGGHDDLIPHRFQQTGPKATLAFCTIYSEVRTGELCYR